MFLSYTGRSWFFSILQSEALLTINSPPESLLQACAPLPAALAPRWLDPGLLPPSSPFQHHMAPASPSPSLSAERIRPRSPWPAPHVGLSSGSGLQPRDRVGPILRDREGHWVIVVLWGRQTERQGGSLRQMGLLGRRGSRPPDSLLRDEA